MPTANNALRIRDHLPANSQMSLSDLSANELARIDAICLEYESRFRGGNPPDISELVARHKGVHADVLRGELEVVRQELQSTLAVTSRTRSRSKAEQVLRVGNVANTGHEDWSLRRRRDARKRGHGGLRGH